MSTPRRDLAPPIEEDEEPESESQGQGAPLRQIENNISALLRGDIPIVRVPGTSIDDIYIIEHFLLNKFLNLKKKQIFNHQDDHLVFELAFTNRKVPRKCFSHNICSVHCHHRHHLQVQMYV